MKTKANCPTCEYPFSFWRVVFALTPYSLYCKNCGWRIVIGRDREILWATYGAFLVITLILAQFIVARDFSRLAVLGVLWIVSFYALEIIVSLLIVNFGRFSQPKKSAEDDDIVAE